MNAIEITQDPTQARAQILALLHLPPLAPVAQELLAALAQEDIAIPPLAEIIERDPGLTARLIGVANSAYFSQPEPIYDLTTAIIRVLGLDLVKSLSLGIALSASFDASRCPAFALNRFWYTAMQTTALVSQLAPQTTLEPDAGEYMTIAGLLHNLGELVLVHTFPSAMARVLHRLGEEPGTDPHSRQTEELGMTASEAGVALGHRWHLPAKIIQVMDKFHDPHFRGPDWRTAALVGYCSHLVNADFCVPGQLPDQDALRRGDTLGLTHDAVIAVLERVQRKHEQTLALAQAMAGGTP